MSPRTPPEKREKALKLCAEGLTQGEIAQRLGINQRTVSLIEIEAGQRRRTKRGSFADTATGLRAPSRKRVLR